MCWDVRFFRFRGRVRGGVLGRELFHFGRKWSGRGCLWAVSMEVF